MFNIHFSIERQKWSDDFGIYVSNKGHFRTRDKKELPIKIGKGGYCYVYCSGNVNGYRLAHRVVMLTWRPLKDGENLTVDHLDHNKRNNALDNLEWVTMEENLRRANQDLLPPDNTEVPIEATFNVYHKTSNKLFYSFSLKDKTIEEVMKWLKLPDNVSKDKLLKRLRALNNHSYESFDVCQYKITVKA